MTYNHFYFSCLQSEDWLGGSALGYRVGSGLPQMSCILRPGAIQGMSFLLQLEEAQEPSLNHTDSKPLFTS